MSWTSRQLRVHRAVYWDVEKAVERDVFLGAWAGNKTGVYLAVKLGVDTVVHPRVSWVVELAVWNRMRRMRGRANGLG